MNGRIGKLQGRFYKYTKLGKLIIFPKCADKKG